MKRNLFVLTLTVLTVGLSSCSAPNNGARYVSTNATRTQHVVRSTPVRTTTTTTTSSRPLYGSLWEPSDPYRRHHYGPGIYTPFAYDHRGAGHETYYRDQAIRHGGASSVEVGPVSAN